MKEKLGIAFIQISLLVRIIVSIVVTIGIGYVAIEYNKNSKSVGEAKQLTKEEKYEEAINKLQLAQASFVVKELTLNKQKIVNEINENGQRLKDKSWYEQGLNEFDKGNWQKSIDMLLGLPESSFYYQKAQIKIEESKRLIVEGELAREKIVRKEAQEEARQETIKRTQEEAARIVAEEKTIQEKVARKVAEQKAENEQLAKEQQQREAEIQRQRADQAEKMKVLELAKTHPLIKAIVSRELKFYIDPLPSYAAIGVSSAVEDISRDFSSWNPYDAQIRRVYNSNDADLTVAWVRDYGSDTIGEAIYRAHVKVGLGLNNCVGDWRAFDVNTVKKILWHELGHSMGYGHSSNPNNVMYSQTATRFEVDQEISEVISGGWSYTIPLCGEGTYSYSFETDDPYMGFDLFVIPSGGDTNSISGGNSRGYIGCGKERMHRYSGSCVVESGSKIYIENISAINTIHLSGKIININNPPWPDMTWDQNVFKYDNNQLTKYWELFR